MKTDDIKYKDITWEDIQKYINEDIYQDFLKQIPLSAFKMALNEKDKQKVIASIMNVLKERDSQNANEEYAQKVADRMRDIAQMVLTKK